MSLEKQMHPSEPEESADLPSVDNRQRNSYKKSKNMLETPAPIVLAEVTPSSAARAAYPAENRIASVQDIETHKKDLGDVFDDEAFLHLMKLPDGKSMNQTNHPMLLRNKNKIRLHAEYLKGSLLMISSTIQGGQDNEGGFLMQAMSAMEDQEFNHIFKKYDIRCRGRVAQKNNSTELLLNKEGYPYYIFIVPMVN